MEDYVIRCATNEDEPFLWDMLYASIHVPEGQAPFERSIVQHPAIAKYVAGWGRQGDVGFIAETVDGTKIGSATARLFTEDNRGFGYVDASIPELGVAVLPEFRGKGVGTRLIRALLDELRQSGCPAVSLSVDLTNPAARLYERMGFVKVGMVENSLTMRLDL